MDLVKEMKSVEMVFNGVRRWRLTEVTTKWMNNTNYLDILLTKIKLKWIKGGVVAVEILYKGTVDH